MANEIKAFYRSGYNLYSIVRNNSGQVWYIAGDVFEAWGTGSRAAADYDIPLTDKSGGMYVGDFDSGIASGYYSIVTYRQAGAAPADDDPVVFKELARWDGTSFTVEITTDTGIVSSYESGAKTRTEIKTAVHNNTGRGTEKESLIETLCDEALKIAVAKHPFRDAQSTADDITIVENATSSNIATISALANIVTARIIEISGSRNAKLKMKDQTWWDSHVVNAEDNSGGWPTYGLRKGSSVYYDCPVNAGLSLRLVVARVPTFGSDGIACPIAVLDTFVVQYVTAQVFAAVENGPSAAFWRQLALGRDWDRGIVGGSLLQAISADGYDIATEHEMDRPPTGDARGISIRNLISGHDREGEVDPWY